MPEADCINTATDLLAFYQMNLNRGTYNGKRLLAPAPVDVMTKWHNLGDPAAQHGQGAGCQVSEGASGRAMPTPEGAYGHSGRLAWAWWIRKPCRSGVSGSTHGAGADTRNAFRRSPGGGVELV
jgi:hypothetical protein